MKRVMITFGQAHVHRVNGKTFDRDCVAIVEGETVYDADKLAFELFKDKFHQRILEEAWDEDDMKYYPRGYIEVQQEVITMLYIQETRAKQLVCPFAKLKNGHQMKCLGIECMAWEHAPPTAEEKRNNLPTTRGTCVRLYK